MPKYPGVGELAARRWLAANASDSTAEPPDVEWMGSGEDVDVAGALDDVMALFGDQLAAVGADSDRDRIEGFLAGPLHEALRGVPVEVLDDPSFWRWVGLAKMWRFVHWRESATFKKDATEYLKYTDGRTTSECVAIRTYLRGRICAELGDPDLAAAVANGTDLWRSHIIRVRVSRTHELAGALIRRQVVERLPATSLRRSARRLNRDLSNLIPSFIDSETAELLVAAAWESADGDLDDSVG